jgi:hypothetical protein
MTSLGKTKWLVGITLLAVAMVNIAACDAHKGEPATPGNPTVTSSAPTV